MRKRDKTCDNKDPFTTLVQSSLQPVCRWAELESTILPAESCAPLLSSDSVTE